MKDKIFDYVERDNWVFRLSGLTKLLCFMILSASVMFTYDIRSILVIMVLSFMVLRLSGITFGQIKVMLWAVVLFRLLCLQEHNASLVFFHCIGKHHVLPDRQSLRDGVILVYLPAADFRSVWKFHGYVGHSAAHGPIGYHSGFDCNTV